MTAFQTWPQRDAPTSPHLQSSRGSRNNQSRANKKQSDYAKHARQSVSEGLRTDEQNAEINQELWNAAFKGDVNQVETIFRRPVPVDVTWVPPKPVLWWKQRPVRGQAIHAACALHGYDNADDDAYEIVSRLLEKRADPKVVADVGDVGDGDRTLQPIHLAAGSGNSKVLELLLEHDADPNAEATYNGKFHYYPIHEAAFFSQTECICSQTECIKLLLQKNAKPRDQNCKGETALHIAAKVGCTEMVACLIQFCAGVTDGQEDSTSRKGRVRQELAALLDIKTKDNQTAFDVAVKDGQFPKSDLYLFTEHLSPDEKVHAFKAICSNCPSAAPAILRDSPDDERDPHNVARGRGVYYREGVSKDWCNVLREGVKQEQLDVELLCALIEDTPEAAIDLLDALTGSPKVISPGHYPLPKCAAIQKHGEEICMSCRYELQQDWHWSPGSEAPDWHSRLAPTCSDLNRKVKIQVVMMRGLANCKLLDCLATTENVHIFTKVVIHGLLRLLWHKYRWVMRLDLVCEFAAILVICIWIFVVPQTELSPTGCAILWCVLAAQGIYQSSLYIWMTMICILQLGFWKTARWLFRNSYRVVIGAFTLGLAVQTQVGYLPGQEDAAILALNGWIHWVLLLCELRAWWWTGKRLIPIMKSVTPVFGMFVILLFMCIAFVSAFWAVQPDLLDEITLMDIVILLFTGQPWLSRAQISAMSFQQTAVTIVLSIGGSVIFLTCLINVFIAVLSDCYEQEQDMKMISFLQGRAGYCTNFLLRPKMVVPAFRQGSSSFEDNFLPRFLHTQRNAILLKVVIWVALIVSLLISSILLAVNPLEVSFSSWTPAVFLALSQLLVQCMAVGSLPQDWDKRYLWICHEVTLKEEEFLGREERTAVERFTWHGVIKKYLHDVAGALQLSIELHSDNMLHKLDTVSLSGRSTPVEDSSSYREEIDSFRRELTEVKTSVARIEQLVIEQRDALQEMRKLAASMVRLRADRSLGNQTGVLALPVDMTRTQEITETPGSHHSEAQSSSAASTPGPRNPISQPL